MTILSLLAASFTFTATATGVEKGTPVEFAFVGSGSDRDYEAMFILDIPLETFCREIEKMGVPRGKPENVKTHTLWPVGCRLDLSPSLDKYIESRLPNGQTLPPFVYTGGDRLSDGSLSAATNMPLSAFAFYSLGQSPIVFDQPFNQGDVYGSHSAKLKLEKGDRIKFTLSWNEKPLPQSLSLTVKKGTAKEILLSLKNTAEKGEVDALVDFDSGLTVKEATAVAQALTLIDSKRVKINGKKEGRLFYRAFLPLTKWTDRQERLVQPFELSLGATNKLVHIEADWSVDGDDPKLTPREIPFSDAVKFKDTDTCFIYCSAECLLEDVYQAMSQLKGSSVRTWYVFTNP